MRRRLLTISAFAAATLATTTGFAEPHSESERVRSLTATRVLELTADAGWESLEGRVEGRVRSGRMDFRFVDPTGEERVAGTCTDGRFALETGELESVAGTWQLEMRFDGATGDYSIEWSGH